MEQNSEIAYLKQQIIPVSEMVFDVFTGIR